MIRILFERFLPLTLYFTTLVSIMIIGTFIPHSSDLFYLWYFGFYWIFYHAIIYVTSFFIGLITQKRNKYTKPYYFLLSSLIFFIINTFALFLPLLSIIKSSYHNYNFETIIYFAFISFISTLIFLLGQLISKKFFHNKLWLHLQLDNP